ncbi:unnamed protein product [Candida verbasci]|uniref:Mitochondrial 15S rRNA processing factor CCM1 n=1 Tax=Candida verbasci TaxID=1227364 RepID=A0A9W4XB23_9ASCO|nr:unnamed protein product [Candida verbasci]
MLKANKYIQNAAAKRPKIFKSYKQDPEVALKRKQVRESIRTKLENFIKHDNLQNYKETKLHRKTDIFQSITNDYTLHHGLKRLKNKYDKDVFLDDDGEVINLQELKKDDMKYNSPMARSIFDNLVRIKQLSDKRIDRRVVLSLLGINGEQVNDSYFVAKHVLELLHLDQDPERALYLCRISNKLQSIVAMNLVMKWYLEKNDLKTAFKLYHDRKRWLIPSDTSTYVTLFDGVAKSFEWGKVDNNYMNKCIDIFKDYRKELQEKKNETVPVKVFNACLSILVKDFNNRQVEAWRFFDELNKNEDLELQEIIPDIQTFTILLQGIKKYIENERVKILESTETTDAKTLKLLDLEVGYTKTFEIIYKRVLELAKPPSETNFQNEKLVKRYLKNKIDIDLPFLSIYLSCLINRSSGTGTSLKSPSHYLYNELGLKILQELSPELQSIGQFLENVTKKSPIEVESSIKHKTDSRISSILKKSDTKVDLQFSNSKEDLIPYKFIKDEETFNSELTFPKLENKSVRTYQSKLINLPETINKFIINQYFDGLVNLGKLNEFVLAFWFSIIKYGGVRLQLKIFQDESNVLDGVIKGKFYNLDSYISKSTVKAKESIIDNSSFNLFIYKVSEHGRSKGTTKTNLIIELFRIFNMRQITADSSINVEFEHIDHIWSVFFNDLKYYNNYNKTNHAQYNSLTFPQLKELMTNLHDFNDAHLLWNRHRFKRNNIPPKSYFKNLTKLFNIVLNDTKWVMTDDEKLKIHKFVIKTFAKYYKPKSLLLKNEIHHEWIQLDTSFNYIFEHMKDKTDLNATDKRILSGIKLIKGLNKIEKDQEKFKELRNELYELIEIDEEDSPNKANGSAPEED